MRIPIASMTKNLQWTRGGTVWATWRLSGLPYAYGTPEMKFQAHMLHQALFQGIRGEALLMGLCASEDPVNVAERMLAGIPIEQTPEWAEEVTLTLDQLEELPIGTRAYWLSVPIPARNFRQRAQSIVRAADTELRDVLGMRRELPGASEVEAAMAAAEAIEQNIPAAFQPTRASAAELVWIALHNQQRGLGADLSVPEPQPRPANRRSTDPDNLVHYLPSEFPEPILDEGAVSDISDDSRVMRRVLKRLNPMSRRYLKVQSTQSEDPSYQVLQALSGTPKGGWVFPGVEWISRVEAFDFQVDWAVRLQVSAAKDVHRRNSRAEANLHDQVKQQSGSGNTITGGASGLDEVADSLAGLHESLNLSDKEVEVQATTVFAVGSPDPDLALAQARLIADDFKQADFLLDRPLGGQEHLWWAMQPGVATSPFVREYTQVTTGREFATAIPLVSTGIGDELGLPFADNISTARHTPVLLDLMGAILADSSSSMGIVAELGGGKSVALKSIAGATLDRLGRIFAIDRTPAQEYAVFARSLTPEGTVIVDLLNPEWSLDPLRVFGPEVGARIVQSLFATLLGVKPRDPLGVALSRLLSASSLQENSLWSLGRLREYVDSGRSQNEELDQLSGLIGLIAEKDFGAVLFDDSIPPLDLDARAVIALTHGLELPDQEEVLNKHLFDEMPLEKIFGRAMYALLTSLAREICFADSSELALFLVDECHHVTASPEGERSLQAFFRDGRKHGAAAIVASHDPYDFGDERTRGLIKLRVVMRQTDKVLAGRALTWLADVGEDAQMLDELMKNTSPTGTNGEVPPDRRGEAFFRDVRGRLAKVRVRLPARPHRRRAVLSTPSKGTELV